jgi:hypothetical protein
MLKQQLRRWIKGDPLRNHSAMSAYSVLDIAVLLQESWIMGIGKL